ncbi:Ionotropic receptor 7c [Carabus blaptoides fortunei]
MVFACNETLPRVLFPRKVPDNLNGCEIKLMAYLIPPYVLNISANREDPTVAGLEVTIMHIIAEELNLTERYISHNFTSWGEKLPNGTITNMFKALDDHDAELIFGMVPLNSPEDHEFESTLIHVTESLIWWVPMADHIPRWKRPMKLFHPQVWFLILASFPVNGLLWWLFGKSKETSDNYKVWYRSILASWRVLLQVTHAPPRYTVTRILYLFFAIFSLLIYTAHESVLVSTLTKPHHEHQIKTVEELLDSKLKYGFFPLIADSYNDSSNWIQREIRITAGYPLLEKFNELLLSMQANGLIGKWDKDITFNQAHKDESQLTALSIGHMALLFVNLLIGLTISFIVFIVEIILKRRKDKKCGKIKSYRLPFIQ